MFNFFVSFSIWIMLFLKEVKNDEVVLVVWGGRVSLVMIELFPHFR